MEWEPEGNENQVSRPKYVTRNVLSAGVHHKRQTLFPLQLNVPFQPWPLGQGQGIT